jgi:hypothetical protein
MGNTTSHIGQGRALHRFAPSILTEMEGSQQPSMLFPPQFPANTAANNQVPMMFYNPYIQYSLMSGQNFPMQNFLPPQMMMAVGDLTSGGTASAKRATTAGQGGGLSRSSKEMAEGSGGAEEESSDNPNLSVPNLQEQQRMMNQWMMANFPSGPMTNGDEFLRTDDYTMPQSGNLLPGGINPFYAGMTTLPSPNFVAPNANWPTTGGTQRGSQEQN